ncbi:MAG: insulinase family protein [Oscillospiraceae bacterium]|jgi:predicted Zn-dependent peptidase|nr:insulinase family protein [Oscillospiraceae bacterium]
MNSKTYESVREQVFSEKLENGLQVFVLPKRGFNKNFAFFATDYGGADRRFKVDGEWIDTPEGVAHFLEHKMFDTKDGGNALSLLSATGAQPNAFTSTQITGYFFSGTENFETNLRVLLDFVSVPYFTDESVNKEQGIIGQEIHMGEDNPSHALYYGLMKLLYANNPIRDSVAGTVESIAEITPKTLYDCHKIFYNPSNMALVVVGDVEPERVCEIAREVLPKEAGEQPLRDYGAPETGVPTEHETTREMEVSQPMFMAGCAAKPVSGGEALQRRDIVGGLAIEMIFGSSSPFALELYSSGAVGRDFGGGFESAVGVAYTMFGGQCRDPQSVYDKVKAEIRRVQAEGFDETRFNRVKKATYGKSMRTFDSFDDVAYGIAQSHFHGFDALRGPEVLLEVTSDEVLKFVRENVEPDNMAISLVLPLKPQHEGNGE